MNIVVMGPVGSGKSTQAELLAEEEGVPLLKVGDLLFFKSKEDTPLGKTIKKNMEAGEIVEDEVTNQIVKEHLKNKSYKNGFVLDGFPRTLKQAEMLKVLIDNVFYLAVSDEENTRRLLARGRKDDTPNLVAKRLAIYHQETEPVLDYYRQQGILEEVDGEKSIEEIHQDIMGRLKK